MNRSEMGEPIEHNKIKETYQGDLFAVALRNPYATSPLKTGYFPISPDEKIYEPIAPYNTPKSVAERDAEMLERVKNSGVKLREGIHRMRNEMRKKYQRCTYDYSYCTYPLVCDVDHDAILIAPARCENPRFVVVTCHLHSTVLRKDLNGVGYQVRVNGSAFVLSKTFSLEEAMQEVEKVIYGKIL